MTPSSISRYFLHFPSGNSHTVVLRAPHRCRASPDVGWRILGGIRAVASNVHDCVSNVTWCHRPVPPRSACCCINIYRRSRGGRPKVAGHLRNTISRSPEVSPSLGLVGIHFDMFSAIEILGGVRGGGSPRGGPGGREPPGKMSREAPQGKSPSPRPPHPPLPCGRRGLTTSVQNPTSRALACREGLARPDLTAKSPNSDHFGARWHLIDGPRANPSTSV